MSKVVVRRCGECGKGPVKMVARPGRVESFRNMPALELPAEFEIPECVHCGAQYLGLEDAERMDAALEQAYNRVLRQRAVELLDLIVPFVPQRQLEPLLGLSQGYLSKLRGEGQPSATLVSELALLAADPKKRVAELERFWATNPAH